MNRCRSLLLVLALIPGVSLALGLGEIQLESALNEPFNARIELLSATANDLNSLNVSLADDAAFRRAGVPREFVLTKLLFSIKESETGPDYIIVTSDDPIREPYLDFLVEINWSQGRLYREYTVLLDPPIYVADKVQKTVTKPYSSAVREPVRETVPEISESREFSRDAGHIVQYPAQEKVSVNYTGGDYGPVASGETLWSIARSMRPDSSVSIQQMMLALLRANPEAFINGNINGLKRGHILKAPDLTEAQSVEKAEAFSQALLQNNAWEEFRQGIAAAPPVRPEGAPAPADTAVIEPDVAAVKEAAKEVKPAEEPKAQAETPMEAEPGEKMPAVVETQPELRLVAPEGAGQTTTQGGAADPAQEALAKELALATETLEALNLENAELKGKIAESDVIMNDLKRLIELKQTELAALQQQVADRAAQPVIATAVPEATQPAAEKQQMEKPATPEQQPAPPPRPAKKKGPSIFKAIKAVAADLKTQIDKYLVYIAGALGGLVVLFAIAYIVQRRRNAPVSIEFPQAVNFGEGPSISDQAEDSTDLNPAIGEGSVDSQAITLVPDSSQDKTQVIAKTAAAPAKAAVSKKPEVSEPPKEEPAAVAEDPLEEVNLFLAYEDFDQAEDFVKKALAKEPDNLAYHVKLLEVYYTANNKKAYEQAARVLHDKTQGTGDSWSMAQAMWQVLSPNRELFATPAAGDEAEEAPVAMQAGGIVNIADDSTGATAGGLDFDLDTTGGGSGKDETAAEEYLEVEEPTATNLASAAASATAENNEMLDFTAAVDSEPELADEQDVNAIEGKEEAPDFSLDMEDKSASEDKSLELSADDLQQTIEAPAAATGEDEALDFSLDMEDKSASEDKSLELSADDLQQTVEAPAAAAGEDEALDFSLVLANKPEEDEQPGDFSLDLVQDNSEASPGTGADENVMDFSLDLDEPGDADKTAMPAGVAQEPDLGLSQGGADLLDNTSAIEFGTNEMEASKAGSSLLDVTSAFNHEQEKKAYPGKTGKPETDILDVSMADGVNRGDDLLDVTASPSFSLENGIDLLNLSATGSVPLKTKTDESAALDFSLSPEGEPGISSESLPITEEDAFEQEMDSTMQIPGGKNAALSTRGKLQEEEAEGDDKTLVVPRSYSGAQSDDDEIATQMDLAKAYIELGNKENAKTILDEIISIGNEGQRRQAQSLLGQIS